METLCKERQKHYTVALRMIELNFQITWNEIKKFYIKKSFRETQQWMLAYLT